LDHLLLLLGSGCLVCLMPLAVYLLYLSHLNGRTPPTLVPGPWDFAAVLLGLSGFLILSGPLFVTLIDSTWRGYAYGGTFADMRNIVRREAMAGSLIAVGYLVLLGTLITRVLRRRRPVTAVYNVAAATTEATIVEVLDQLGFPWRRNGGGVEIGIHKVTDPAAPPAQFFAQQTATLRVDPFPSVGHATLRWDGPYDGVRAEVEAALPGALAVYSGGKSAIAGWLFTAAVSILIVMLLWLVVLIYIIMTPQ
jgi:hypothetical protein